MATALLLLAPQIAAAGRFDVLHSFCSEKPLCTDGDIPTAPLVRDAAGNLYGTTAHGGTRSDGVAFELKRKGRDKYTYKVLANFSSGVPAGRMVLDVNGNLYGQYGGGGFFKLSPGFGAHHNRWRLFDLSVSCSQQDCGSELRADLTYEGEASGAPYDGTSPLFGSAASGGATGHGTIFSLAPNGAQWDQVVLYNFCSQGGDSCLDGDRPQGGVALDTAGNVFGTTANGGGNTGQGHGSGAGIFFELVPNGNSWVEKVLYRFCGQPNCTDGAVPTGDITFDSADAVYGTTSQGGKDCKKGLSRGCGTVYRLNGSGDAWQETVLYAFCQKKDCKDGYDPEAGVIIDQNGQFFGTTRLGGGNDIDQLTDGGGTAFELAGSDYTVLHSFCSLPMCADGEYPAVAFIEDGAGNLDGVTTFGGPNGGVADGGTVFRIQR